MPQLQGAGLVRSGAGKQPPKADSKLGRGSLVYPAAGDFGYRVSLGSFFQVNRFLVDELVDLVAAGRKGDSPGTSMLGSDSSRGRSPR